MKLSTITYFFSFIVLLVQPVSAQFSPEQACQFAQGTMDSQGICRVCLGPDSCQCILDPLTFGVNCAEGTFCSTNVVYQNLPDTYCGQASCYVTGVESECTSSIDIIDGALEASLTCATGNVCSCNSVTWNGSECLSCEGALEAYDCSSLNGPVKVSSGGGDGPTSPTKDLKRTYRNDTAFQEKVDRLSLHDASNLAGVPIGAAISPSFGGLETFVPTDYNMIVSENDMKWNKFLYNESDPFSYDFSAADSLVTYAKDNNVRVRGHVLIWGRISGTTYPAVVKEEALKLDSSSAVVKEVELGLDSSSARADYLRNVMDQHIQTVVQHFGRDVDVWDVVNEHLSSKTDDNIFWSTFGDDYVKESFILANKYSADNTLLAWNEAIGVFALDNPTISARIDLLAQYKDEGVPIDIVGIQGHSISKKHNLTELATLIQTVVDMGYGVELTEIDAPITLFLDEEDPFEAQGEYLAAYVETCLKSGGCKGITFWGVSDAYTWLDGVFSATAPNLPLLIDEEGFRKPVWVHVRDVLENCEIQDTPGPTSMPTTSPTSGSKSGLAPAALSGWFAVSFVLSLIFFDV